MNFQPFDYRINIFTSFVEEYCFFRERSWQEKRNNMKKKSEQ